MISTLTPSTSHTEGQLNAGARRNKTKTNHQGRSHTQSTTKRANRKTQRKVHAERRATQRERGCAQREEQESNRACRVSCLSLCVHVPYAGEGRKRARQERKGKEGRRPDVRLRVSVHVYAQSVVLCSHAAVSCRVLVFWWRGGVRCHVSESSLSPTPKSVTPTVARTALHVNIPVFSCKGGPEFLGSILLGFWELATAECVNPSTRVHRRVQTQEISASDTETFYLAGPTMCSLLSVGLGLLRLHQARHSHPKKKQKNVTLYCDIVFLTQGFTQIQHFSSWGDFVLCHLPPYYSRQKCIPSRSP